MKKWRLRQLIFVALCCDLGLFSKRLIGPAANLLTDALHIPGGIGTSFSLMFLTIPTFMMQLPGCGLIMGIVQSVLAISFGMVGSMGALSPIGYMVPGLVIDLVLLITGKINLPLTEQLVLANALSAVSAAFTADLIVFHLWGPPLWLYLSVAAASGTVCGLLGASVTQRLAPLLGATLQEGGEAA